MAEQAQSTGIWLGQTTVVPYRLKLMMNVKNCKDSACKEDSLRDRIKDMVQVLCEIGRKQS